MTSVSAYEEEEAWLSAAGGSRKAKSDRCNRMRSISECDSSKSLSYRDQSWLAVAFGGGDFGVSAETSGRGVGCLTFGGVLAYLA